MSDATMNPLYIAAALADEIYRRDNRVHRGPYLIPGFNGTRCARRSPCTPAFGIVSQAATSKQGEPCRPPCSSFRQRMNGDTMPKFGALEHRRSASCPPL